MPQRVGVVLAGGEGRRLGRHKQDLRVGGRPLAERAAAVASKVGVRLEVLAFGEGKGFIVEQLGRIAGLTGGRLTRVEDVRSATYDLGGP